MVALMMQTHTDTPAFIASNANIKDLCLARCIHATELRNCTGRRLRQMSLVYDYQMFRPKLARVFISGCQQC